mmetsp:Transcript_89663/g.287529  ORF Transcript_89663/g.287529 Transcript_89663/m.287529 type:complete len:294 (+) Transcript_89663:353-1234(+)
MSSRRLLLRCCMPLLVACSKALSARKICAPSSSTGRATGKRSWAPLCSVGKNMPSDVLNQPSPKSTPRTTSPHWPSLSCLSSSCWVFLYLTPGAFVLSIRLSRTHSRSTVLCIFSVTFETCFGSGCLRVSTGAPQCSVGKNMPVVALNHPLPKSMPRTTSPQPANVSTWSLNIALLLYFTPGPVDWSWLLSKTYSATLTTMGIPLCSAGRCKPDDVRIQPPPTSMPRTTSSHCAKVSCVSAKSGLLRYFTPGTLAFKRLLSTRNSTSSSGGAASCFESGAVASSLAGAFWTID